MIPFYFFSDITKNNRQIQNASKFSRPYGRKGRKESLLVYVHLYINKDSEFMQDITNQCEYINVIL